MTRNPEAVSPRDRIAYALNRMSVAGYRTIPVVDAETRPIGVVTVTDFIRWLVICSPEAVLNIRPETRSSARTRWTPARRSRRRR